MVVHARRLLVAPPLIGDLVDRLVPLARDGADAPSTMPWQTAARASAKDNTERVGCR